MPFLDSKPWKALLRSPLSSNNLTLVRKLTQKKHREREGMFLAEGLRCISELIDGGMRPKFLVFSDDFPEGAYQEYESYSLGAKIFSEISRHQTNQGCLAVFENILETPLPTDGKILMLDTVQDPGNLGTIVRSAVWFGVDHIVLGSGCADLFNSKTVSATSGALASLKFSKANLGELLGSKKNRDNVYGLLLNENATPLPKIKAPTSWNLILGNEGNGISESLNGLYIPVFIPGVGGVESLNVAATAAISLYHFANF